MPRGLGDGAAQISVRGHELFGDGTGLLLELGLAMRVPARLQFPDDTSRNESFQFCALTCTARSDTTAFALRDGRLLGGLQKIACRFDCRAFNRVGGLGVAVHMYATVHGPQTFSADVPDAPTIEGVALSFSGRVATIAARIGTLHVPATMSTKDRPSKSATQPAEREKGCAALVSRVAQPNLHAVVRLANTAAKPNHQPLCSQPPPTLVVGKIE